ncbi:MAG: radical SAM-associated putative lipoprotein [Candidatus Amulumruptor sp.]|nr:radical SAM-associated putative lipoprotein [Candidatus Amulumruptor sp.]MDE7236660.1 radical SAM-associated putative lipoprotein [Paramuribaculum sp.]
MKRLSIKVSSLLGRVSALGLAILGFAACSEEQYDMYGCPTGTFEIKGAVTAESDGASVAGASIVVKPTDAAHELSNPVLTDSKGNYILDQETNPYDKVRVVCTPAEESGLAADSADVELKYLKDGKKHSGWYVGHAESTVNFKLKAKAEPDNDTE